MLTLMPPPADIAYDAGDAMPLRCRLRLRDVAAAMMPLRCFIFFAIDATLMTPMLMR